MDEGSIQEVNGTACRFAVTFVARTLRICKRFEQPLKLTSFFSFAFSKHPKFHAHVSRALQITHQTSIVGESKCGLRHRSCELLHSEHDVHTISGQIEK